MQQGAWTLQTDHIPPTGTCSNLRPTTELLFNRAYVSDQTRAVCGQILLGGEQFSVACDQMAAL